MGDELEAGYAVATLWESAARGGAATLSLAIALILVRLEGRVARLGALFALGSAAYALVSEPAFVLALGGLGAPLAAPLAALAIANSVFFWWFASALFDDGFRWRPWRFAPLAALILAEALRLAGLGALALDLAQRALTAALAIHAIALAAGALGDDLVEARRRFRVIFALAVGAVVLSVAAVEALIYLGLTRPEVWRPLQAGVLWAYALGFAVLMLAPRAALFAALSEAPRTRDDAAAPEQAIAPRDRPALDRLRRAEAEGALFEEGLSVGRLAEHVGLPEHRLRRIINQGLGYRNFAAYLNAHRVARAQALLADPAQAELQIAQIALEVGYGSLGPFNRAFKDVTGQTPSAWRAERFGGAEQPPAAAAAPVSSRRS